MNRQENKAPGQTGFRFGIKPEFNQNYAMGMVGFSRVAGDFVSEGIQLVTGDEALSGITVSHAFLVESEKYCIEATGQGVVRNYLDHYFDKKYEVFFHRPLNMDADKAAMLLDAARAHLGQGYSYGGIFGMLLAKLCRLGDYLPYINRCRNPFNSRSTWFCSELVAFSLHCLPDYRDSRLLQKWHPSRISPQRLFEASELWKPWKLNTEEVREHFKEHIISEEVLNR